MPITNNLAGAEIAFALGATASSPAYALPLFSGLPVPRQDIAITDPASPLAVAQDARKADLRWGASVTVPALPGSIGLFAKAMLWSEAVSGTTHTITPGTTQQYVTAFSRRPGDLYERWASGSMEELTISGDGRDPLLQASVGLVGLSSTVTSAYSAATTETMTGALTAHGSTITANWGAGAEVLTNVTDLSVRFSRPTIVAADYNSASGQRVDHKSLGAEVSLTLLYSDYASYRAAFYGGASGSTLSGTLAEGAFSVLFEQDSNSVTLALARVAWSVDAPEASGDGGSVTANLTGTALLPASGAFATVTVVNDRSTAY